MSDYVCIMSFAIKPLVSLSHIWTGGCYSLSFLVIHSRHSCQIVLRTSVKDGWEIFCFLFCSLNISVQFIFVCLTRDCDLSAASFLPVCAHLPSFPWFKHVSWTFREQVLITHIAYGPASSGICARRNGKMPFSTSKFHCKRTENKFCDQRWCKKMRKLGKWDI